MFKEAIKQRQLLLKATRNAETLASLEETIEKNQDAF